MECPICQIPLYETKYKKIEVDRCQKCHGIWLDYHELDELEDKTFASDDLKGTLMYAVRDSKQSCPRCMVIMKTFNYRGYNLPIDVCQNNDGFWLDKGEADQVETLMKQRIKDLKRSASAESAWEDLIKGLKGGKGKSLMERILGR